MATEYPGVAKFGIALEWGSRGLEFESQHSDQKYPYALTWGYFFISSAENSTLRPKAVLSLF